MDQLICASLSHTHDWYEVGMLKVPAGYVCMVCVGGCVGPLFIAPPQARNEQFSHTLPLLEAIKIKIPR